MEMEPSQSGIGSDAPPGPAAVEPEPASGPRSLPHVLFPNHYTWFVFLAALDIMMTYLIMNPAVFSHDAEQLVPRGEELNPLANWIIRTGGTPGKVIYKFTLVMLVVCICEYVGRRKLTLGRSLAEWAIALTSIPVIVALLQMLVDVLPSMLAQAPHR
jgi:hypothetical protein